MLVYAVCQELSKYTLGSDPIPLEQFSNYKLCCDGEIDGLRILNPNARVFVAHGASFTNAVISGKGDAFIFIGRDAVIHSTDIACHAKKNVFVAGFNCRLEGLFTHIYASIGIAILSPGVTTQAGCNFCVQENSYILLGSDCMLSTNVFLRTSDSHGVYDRDTLQRINGGRPVILHPHVWISRAATLNKGTEIGPDAMVGQGAVANGSLRGSAIYAGAPAVAVRDNVTWDRRQAEALDQNHEYVTSHFLPTFATNVARVRQENSASAISDPVYAAELTKLAASIGLASKAASERILANPRA
jgi:acetyltransferase-like isoleucine patch superfamily enzyme